MLKNVNDNYWNKKKIINITWSKTPRTKKNIYEIINIQFS